MKRQEVRLMFFSGFYESIHDSAFDEEIAEIMDVFEGKKYDNFRFVYDYLGYCKRYVAVISGELGLDLKFQELISPREYNFTTDRIICWIAPKDVKKLATVLNSPTLEKMVKERFTRRDGFIPFYSAYVEDWKEKKIAKWDAVELGTLLDAWIIENDLDLENLDYVGYEYCQGNGQYVDYVETEESKERTKEAERLAEKKAELAELHEQELEKLDKWNKNVSVWKDG